METWKGPQDRAETEQDAAVDWAKEFQQCGPQSWRIGSLDQLVEQDLKVHNLDEDSKFVNEINSAMGKEEIWYQCGIDSRVLSAISTDSAGVHHIELKDGPLFKDAPPDIVAQKNWK